jgi:hypothetical protein
LAATPLLCCGALRFEAATPLADAVTGELEAAVLGVLEGDATCRGGDIGTTSGDMLLLLLLLLLPLALMLSPPLDEALEVGDGIGCS